ncbi:hypothetical protein ACFQZI_16345 [Mucilaginibacter lutimaris]|uniref:Uncharacterized protein n=1 Tax=Mucilaginibacter lutimaris TaxID=931629 RepID=A0ABW2ZJZ2_9SPHI
MKKLFIYLSVTIAICMVSCKGSSTNNNADSSKTDSGQAHVGGSTAADSSKLPVTPVETGGQDTSADGTTNTNPAKDTVNTRP